MTNRLPLNQGQKEVADAFFDFLFSDEREMGISGPGGVGKTFLMSHLIDDIIPRYHDMCSLMGLDPVYTQVEMTAMTNKAAEVLSVGTGRHVSTVHSFMNLKVTDDYTTGESKITPTGAYRVHENVILFIDECSMYDEPLDKFVTEGTHKSKIVYVGDHCQMKPVKGINPLYRPGRMKWYQLTEQMRTGIPEIQALHAQLRHTVETGEFLPIKIVPGIIDHLNDDQMQLGIAQHFSQQTMDTRLLAYTNKRVIAYNDYIRDLRGLPEEYTLGELLVNNSAIRLKNSMLSVEEEVELTHLGTEYEVDIAPDVKMKVRDATLRTRIGGEYEGVPLPSDRSHYAALVAYFKKQKNWPSYYGLRNKYPDLRQRDAATVYKSQGSTYDSAFIDLGDISNCHNPDQAARMLYVGLSRERYRIFLYGQLADKYGGLVR